MMFTRLTAIAGLVFCTYACASDPNKTADDAHSAELKTERKQSENDATQRGDARIRAAEVPSNSGPDAKLTEARDTFRAKATERLDKADARTTELKALVGKAGTKATTASRDSLQTVDTQRALVSGQINQLPNVANDDFKQAKTNIDTQLDTLDGLVKKAASEVDKFKN